MVLEPKSKSKINSIVLKQSISKPDYQRLELLSVASASAIRSQEC